MPAKKPADKKVFDKRKLITSELLFDTVLDNYTLRNNQKRAIDWFADAISKGKKYFVCDLPTGSGKSLFSLLVAKYYLSNINADAKFDLLTCTKNLQNQYLNDFPFMNNLWGKGNYTCDKWSNSCEYGKTCNTNRQETCEDCPHVQAQDRWMNGKISLTNFHILGLFSIFMPHLMKQRNPNMLIVDEAHSFEQTINSFVSFSISKKQWEKVVDSKKSTEFEKVFDIQEIEDLVEWLDETYLPRIKSKLNSLVRTGSIKKEDVKLTSELNNLVSTISNFLDSYADNPSDWVADKKNIKGVLTWSIQPLWTGKILKKNVWSKYNHVLMMSGTIIDPDMFCELNGIPIEDTAFIRLNNDFPVENRPIYYMPVGKMTFKNKTSCWEQMKPYIEKLLKKYEGKKGIIHTGNYELWQWLKDDLGHNKRLLFIPPDGRQEGIDKHINDTGDSVLVSPSMTQGVDLKDDLSRFQIIMKMPYPSLASKVNKTRFEKNPKWYAWATILDLVQSYGRSIRSEDDWADTVILDGCFSDLFNQNTRMFPKYFTKAVKKITKT